MEEHAQNAVMAVDIGTTNIEAVLFGETGETLTYKSVSNEQKKFGSDVALRICAARDGHLDELRAIILSQLGAMVTEFATGRPELKITDIIIAGNTSMLHILQGFDCAGLGEYPFTPVSLEESFTTTHELIGSFLENVPDFFPDIPVTILPGISAYVGADVFAGIVAMDMAESTEVNMLIDLGTNAEIVLGSRERMLVTSAAAGPAFESGRIFKGTEGIEMIYRLKELEVIDENGTMTEEYFEQPAQKNIRRLQLAKAAISAAVAVLLKEFGISAREVANIYISGNFGNNVNENACIGVGMLPEGFRGRIKACGNTVLKGCYKYFTNISAENTKKILSLSREVVLANDPDFNELLISSVNI
ncbi:MAG: ASKHA domain-containing protein [Lachnospiraceae bacterium]|nr:ASKHA domain-containing protein [Lachnospiraceae bacterium]